MLKIIPFVFLLAICFPVYNNKLIENKERFDALLLADYLHLLPFISDDVTDLRIVLITIALCGEFTCCNILLRRRGYRHRRKRGVSPHLPFDREFLNQKMVGAADIIAALSGKADDGHFRIKFPLQPRKRLPAVFTVVSSYEELYATVCDGEITGRPCIFK